MSMPGPIEMLVILLVALLLFGANKLPEIGKSLGKSIQEFKRAFQGEEKKPKD